MSIHSRLGDDPPVHPASHVTTPVIPAAPPFGRSYLFFTAHWPKSDAGRRRLSRQRKHLALLSCTLLVAFIFGAHFCWLKSRSGRRAVVTTRRLAGADDDELRMLEEAFVLEFCQFLSELAGSPPLGNDQGETSGSTGSVETSNETPDGSRKRKAGHIQQQDSTAIETTQDFSGYLTDFSSMPATFLPPPPAESYYEAENGGQHAKRIRMAEWGIDPMADVDLLLEASQSVSSDVIGDGSDSLTAMLASPLSQDAPTSQALPTGYQSADMSEGTPFILYWQNMVSSTIAAYDTSENMQGGGWATDASLSNSDSSGARSALPQLEIQNRREDNTEEYNAWGGQSGGYEMLSTALLTQLQQLSQAPENEGELNSPSTSSPSGPTLQLTAGSSTDQQDSGFLAQQEQSSQESALREDEHATQATPVDDEDQLREHPFFRVPPLAPGVKVAYFKWQCALRSLTIPRKVPQKLLEFQKLIRKQELSQEDVDALLDLSWDLLRYANASANNRVMRSSLSDVVEPLSIRFLTADALWCTCEILGRYAEKDGWWDKVMEPLTATPLLYNSSENRKPEKWEVFILQLCDALAIYRKGDRPPAAEVIEIKKTMFGPPAIHRCFNGMVWDWWRRDLALYEESE